MENQKTKKADNHLIVDEFDELERITHALKVLRDGIKNAHGNEDLRVWQDLIDMCLEHEIAKLNNVLMDLSGTFEGLTFKPIRPEKYGLFRGNKIFERVDEWEAAQSMKAA